MLRVNFKVGDKQTAPGKEYLGIKDGMPIDFIDTTNDWDPIISDDTQSIFCVCDFPDSWKPLFVDAVQDNADKIPSNFRAKKSLITFSQLESALGRPGLEADLRSGNKVSILDCTSLPQSILKSSLNLNPAALDHNATTGGIVTIGSDGTFPN